MTTLHVEETRSPRRATASIPPVWEPKIGERVRVRWQARWWAGLCRSQAEWQGEAWYHIEAADESYAPVGVLYWFRFEDVAPFALGSGCTHFLRATALAPPPPPPWTVPPVGPPPSLW